MRVAVLGGMGLQGKAALLDLSRSPDVDQVVCADVFPKDPGGITRFLDMDKIKMIRLDASSMEDIVSLLRSGIDVAIDLLPLDLMPIAFEAAIEAEVPLVSTNYAYSVRHLHDRAAAAGVALMPECGLDPGIDLILCGQGAGQFDELHLLNSYCGGIPEKAACDNPLNYKAAWNWDLVLRSQMRDSVLIKDGRRLTVPAEDQHDNDMIHEISFGDLGELEAFPNGDAVSYTDILGVTGTIQETGRYALRWPGWCALLDPLKKLGFLSKDFLRVQGCPVTPHQFLVELIGPRIRYGDDEKDIVVMRNVFEGVKDGKKKRIVTELSLQRDLDTGLFAMNRGVGYPASIVARMMARGEITGRGLLSPAMDVPYEIFRAELSLRGIEVNETVEQDV